ncbi:2Fe-2S iron-sulfur cluster-binding protein, partial [Pelomicrobium sp. G1]|uniref:2Fe-2S iron-sulfur cluster-binding protein n=1 Tax=Pelomicrobium sp. G1 TaxID=3452920 RepID=UPI003F767ECC
MVTFVEQAQGKAAHRSVACEAGATLIEAAFKAGVEIDATFGARGRCRSCRVKVLAGEIPPPTVQDTFQLG